MWAFASGKPLHAVPEMLMQELIREILNYCRQRIRGRLAETADRCIPHCLAQFVEQLAVPDWFLHQQRRLLGTDTARRALAAAFVLKETHQMSAAPYAVLLGQDDDRGRTDKAAVFFQRARNRAEYCPSMPAGCRRTRRPADKRGSYVPLAMPPQNSSINSRTVMPAGASFMPGFFTRPDTE